MEEVHEEITPTYGCDKQLSDDNDAAVNDRITLAGRRRCLSSSAADESANISYDGDLEENLEENVRLLSMCNSQTFKLQQTLSLPDNIIFREEPPIGMQSANQLLGVPQHFLPVSTPDLTVDSVDDERISVDSHSSPDLLQVDYSSITRSSSMPPLSPTQTQDGDPMQMTNLPNQESLPSFGGSKIFGRFSSDDDDTTRLVNIWSYEFLSPSFR